MLVELSRDGLKDIGDTGSGSWQKDLRIWTSCYYG